MWLKLDISAEQLINRQEGTFIDNILQILFFAKRDNDHVQSIKVFFLHRSKNIITFWFRFRKRFSQTIRLWLSCIQSLKLQLLRISRVNDLENKQTRFLTRLRDIWLWNIKITSTHAMGILPSDCSNTWAIDNLKWS